LLINSGCAQIRNFFRVEENLDFSLEKETEVINWIKKVLKQENKTAGNIAYLFCTDEYLLKINRQFLKHDFFIPILSPLIIPERRNRR